MLLGLSIYTYMAHGNSNFTVLSLFDMSTTTVGPCDHMTNSPFGIAYAFYASALLENCGFSAAADVLRVHSHRKRALYQMWGEARAQSH